MSVPLLLFAILAAQDAQPGPAAGAPPVTVTASARMVIQPDGTPTTHRIRPPFGGVAPAFAVGVERAVTRKFGIGVEGGLGAEISRAQRHSYFYTDDFVTAERDITLDVLGRLDISRVGEFVVGAGLTVRRIRLHSQVTTYPLSGQPPRTSPDVAETELLETVIVGADVHVRAGRTLLLPGVRVRWAPLGMDDWPAEYAGVSPLQLQFGLGVRFLPR